MALTNATITPANGSMNIIGSETVNDLKSRYGALGIVAAKDSRFVVQTDNEGNAGATVAYVSKKCDLNKPLQVMLALVSRVDASTGEETQEPIRVLCNVGADRKVDITL